MIVNLASLTLLSNLETCARRKIKFSGDFLGIPVFREGYICAMILFNLVIKSIKIVATTRMGQILCSKIFLRRV